MATNKSVNFLCSGKYLPPQGSLIEQTLYIKQLHPITYRRFEILRKCDHNVSRNASLKLIASKRTNPPLMQWLQALWCNVFQQRQLYRFHENDTVSRLLCPTATFGKATSVRLTLGEMTLRGEGTPKRDRRATCDSLMLR
jgi:hypothetical protein